MNFRGEVLDYVASIYEDPIGFDCFIEPDLPVYMRIDPLKLFIDVDYLVKHSEYFVPNDYQKRKLDAAHKIGYSLITVWEDDWRDRKNIVKKMLKHKLGLSDAPRIFARKTEVDLEVTTKEAKDFCELNHIQGFTRAKVKTGLRDSKGNLVALSMWAVYPAKKEAVLVRYCTSKDVVGGFSKILKHTEVLLKDLDVKTLVTFADYSVSTGLLYEKTGWVVDKLLNPDYSYIVDMMRVHKFNYRLKRFKTDPELYWEEGLTEKQLAEVNNLLRVYDYGKIRYVKHIDNYEDNR